MFTFLHISACRTTADHRDAKQKSVKALAGLTYRDVFGFRLAYPFLNLSISSSVQGTKVTK